MLGTYLKQTFPLYILLSFTHSLPCHTQSSESYHIDLSVSKLPYRLTCCQRIQMELSSLSLSFMPTLQAGTSPSLLFSRILLKYTVGVAFNHSEVFECTHLKFTVSDQTNKQTYTHTCNAVTLVWGLLRLALIKYSSLYNTHKPYSE